MTPEDNFGDIITKIRQVEGNKTKRAGQTSLRQGSL